MSRLGKLIILALALLLLFTDVSGAQQPPVDFKITDRTPRFSESERALIHEYFKRIHAVTAPGSIDRSDLPLAIEKSLVKGGRVPVQYEKKFEPIPEALRKYLSLIPGNYAYYKLGKHVLIVNKATLDIADVVRGAGWEK